MKLSKATGAKKALQKTREREEYLKALVDVSSEIYWEQDAQYRYTLILGRVVEDTGFNPQAFLGAARWDNGAVPVGDGGRWDAHRRVLESREGFRDFLYKLANARGKVAYVSTSGQPVFNAKGKFTGYRGMSRGVTRQIRMEQQHDIQHQVTRILAQSEPVEDTIPSIIGVVCNRLGWVCGARWEIDGDAARQADRFIMPSADFEAFLAPGGAPVGMNASTVVGRAWAARAPVWIEDLAADATFERAAKAGLRSALAFPIMAQNEVLGVVELYSREVHQSDAGMLASRLQLGHQIADFLRRKSAERAVRESAARFRSLTELSSDWYWEQDEDLHFTTLSGAAQAKSGHPAAVSIGKALWELPDIAPVSNSWDELKTAMAARQTFRELECRRTGDDGEAHFVSLSGMPIVDEDGRFFGYRGTGRDITEKTKRTLELKRTLETLTLTQGQLVQSGKMAAIGQLAAGVAHEINNPLGVILGFAQGLDRRVPEGDPLRTPVAAILRETLRCKALVQEMLTFSRTAKKTVEEIDLNELIRAAGVLLESRARIQSIDVTYALSAHPLRLKANKTQIQQVLVNLGTNAMDAMPDGGTLKLRTGRDDEGRVWFDVSDSGVGIPENIRPHIFEPFFTTKEVGKGTGLGLSLVHEIVEQHGGTIDVDSAAGRGTTLSVRFPVARC